MTAYISDIQYIVIEIHFVRRFSQNKNKLFMFTSDQISFYILESFVVDSVLHKLSKWGKA